VSPILVDVRRLSSEFQTEATFEPYGRTDWRTFAGLYGRQEVTTAPVLLVQHAAVNAEYNPHFRGPTVSRYYWSMIDAVRLTHRPCRMSLHKPWEAVFVQGYSGATLSRLPTF